MSKLSIKTFAIASVVGGAVLGATFASAALVLPTQNCSYSFDRNFKLGSTGTDVMNLQKVLNAYPQTQVSASGAGSPGMESTYYGAKTKTAVIKFQNLHASDILTPNGLTVGNGNVYASTRSVLNQICSGVAQTPTTPTTSTVAGCTSTIGFSPTTGQSCAAGVVTTPATTGPVSVSLSAGQPQQMIVVGQSGAKLADFTFTGNGTVTNIQLQRVGISTDSTLSNVYLYDGNTRITDAASVVTGGYINFNSPSGLFTVNGSRTISVRADIASGAAAGNSVGVQLNSVTTQGGSAATFTNVVGNQLVLASVATLTTVAFADVDGTALSVDAGTTNYNVWSGSATISNRSANLKAATFKFVGSAPTDALANISLYVDGVKVGNSSTINAANNNKVTFDLGATPYVLTTGTHTVDVRADIVKGSYRTITMSIENVSDLMIEDSSLPGVNVSATFNSAAFTQTNATYGTITVNKGSVTTNVDPSFVTSRVTGGATNVPVGSFVMRAYGEDVKVNTLQVTFSTTTNSTFNNVSLYVNGGQVGTSQNFAGQPLSYTLGSSLIIPANTSVTLAVKADMVNTSGAAYTAGTIATVIGGVASNAQGQSSYEVISVASTAVTGNTLTISSGAGTFAKTSGFVNATVSPNTSNVKIGSFTLNANSAESIKITSMGINPVVSGSNGSAANAITNYSNLTLKTGSTVLGTPVGNPASGTTTFSFGEIVLPANGSQTFDVYADIGNAASSTSNPAVTVAAAVTYRGSISNTTTVSAASGATISAASATLAAPTLVSSSPVAQYVVGGQTFGIATFKLKTVAAGTQAVVNELRFVTTGADAITNITVGGVTIGAEPATTATTTFTGLNIPVTSSGTDVPVTVQFANVTTAGVAAVSIALNYVGGTSGTSGVISTTSPATSNSMKLYASKPTVTGPSVTTGALVAGTIKIGEFTIAADSHGNISVSTTSVIISTSTSGTLNVTNVKLSDDGGATAITNSNTVANVNSGTAFELGFTTPYEISAGTSKTFSIYGTLGGAFGASGASSMSTQLDSTVANFIWNDVTTGSTGLTGAGIQNFGVGAYTLKN